MSRSFVTYKAGNECSVSADCSEPDTMPAVTRRVQREAAADRLREGAETLPRHMLSQVVVDIAFFAASSQRGM